MTPRRDAARRRRATSTTDPRSSPRARVRRERVTPSRCRRRVRPGAAVRAQPRGWSPPPAWPAPMRSRSRPLRRAGGTPSRGVSSRRRPRRRTPPRRAPDARAQPRPHRARCAGRRAATASARGKGYRSATRACIAGNRSSIRRAAPWLPIGASQILMVAAAVSLIASRRRRSFVLSFRDFRPVCARRVTPRMTGPAARLELGHNRSQGVRVRRDVVVLEKIGGSAVDARAVALAHHASLPRRRMAPATRCIDRAAFSVVDQRAQERRRRDAFH